MDFGCAHYGGFNYEEEISINFGEKPFLYNVTGYTPWSKSIIPTCFATNQSSKLLTLVFILFVSS